MTFSKSDDARLFVRAIEEKVKWRPDHAMVRFPGEDWEARGYSIMTWRQYLDGINKVAHWLDEKLGKSTNNDTAAYMGPNDIRYAFIWPALNKTNRKFLVPDGRITKPGVSHLLKVTDCKVWLHAEEDASSVEELGIKQSSAKILPFPSLEWCLSADGTPDYPYEKTWEEASPEAILIIHTSGTTGEIHELPSLPLPQQQYELDVDTYAWLLGMPKPIFTNNGYWACETTVDILSRKHWPKGTILDPQYGKMLLTACPPKWGGGLATIVGGPLFWDAVTVVPPPDDISFSPSTFTKLLRLNKVQCLWSPPQTVVGLYNDPTTNSLLKNLDSIVFLGASLDKAIGNDLCMHTKLMSFISSTETGMRHMLNPRDRKLWYTFEFAPETPHRYIKQEGTGTAADGSDDLYELVFDRPPDGKLDLFCAAWWNPMFKDADVVETRELYSPVQDIGGTTRWAFRGRLDDLLKSNWLAKFNAKNIEAIILQHADVKRVLVGGEGRPVPFVIVEPKDGAMEGRNADGLLDEIYDHAVAEANAAGVGEIRIPRETVFLAKTEKPFQVNAKHMVMRKHVEQDYAEEIEEAFARLKNVSSNGGKVA